MNLARIKALSMMVCALCKVQRVTYTKLVAAFDSNAASGSSLRRIQRLIAQCEISTDLIAKLILKLIPVQGPYNLTLDRTKWKFSDTNINILTLGIIYDGMAFPIVFKMMDKRGNSNTRERIDLINRFIRLAGENSIKHLDGIYYVNGQACYLSGSKIKDKEGKPELQILVSYCNAEEALEMYKLRWQVETMFKGMKSSGFDIEGSHVRDQSRMSNLFAIIMIAYVWCYLVGIYIHQNIKPITVLKHKRKAVSLFKYGLDYIFQCPRLYYCHKLIQVFDYLSCT